MKKSVIFFPFDLHSHYLRCLRLAEAIRDDFDVSVASSQEARSNQVVAERGFAIVECKTIDAARMSRLEGRLDHSWMKQEELEPIFLDQVRVLESLRPDLVISDFSITLAMAAEYTSTRCYSLIIGHLSQYSRMTRKAPAQHPGIKLLNRLHCPEWAFPPLTAIGERIELRSMHRGIRRIRDKYGLPPRENYFDELESEFNLVTDVEDFSPMKDLPGNFAYIGPVFHSQQQREDEIIARLDPAKRTVLVSLGTFWKSDDLYALFNDPVFRAFNVVIAGKPEVTLAPEIIHKPFINLNAVLPHSDVLVCHGGDATVCQGLAHALPMLGMAFHGEQSWSLQRVALLDFGAEIALPMRAADLAETLRFWIRKKETDKYRFESFARKISPEATRLRFREVLLHLNERTVCSLCHQGSLESSKEVVNVPSDVRRYQYQFSTTWRCPACASIHSLRRIDLADYYEEYPYDQIGNNRYVERAKRNLVRIVKRYGVSAQSEILFAGPLATVTQEVFRRCGLTRFDVLKRPARPEAPWHFPDKRYDFVILINCLCANDDPLTFLTQVHACLNPGGRVMLHTPNAEKLDLKNVSSIVHDLHQPYRLHIYSKSILLRLARSAGLDLVDCQDRHFWDTLYPFVNQRMIHALDNLTDGSVEATVDPSDLKFTRWWHLPYLLYVGLLGGVFARRRVLLSVFQRV